MWQPSNLSARHEALGTSGATSLGTSITSGSAGSKGSWTDVGGATAFAYEAITVCIRSRGTTSVTFDNLLFDVGVSDGSNRSVLCADLHNERWATNGETDNSFYIPVHVPAGAQLSVREQASNSSSVANAHVSIIGHASGLGGAPGFSRCVALFTPSSSRGISIDPGGTANTKGAWTEMSSSCPEDIGAMFGTLGHAADTARAASATALIDIGIGAASSEYVIYPNAYIQWGAVKDGPAINPRIPLFACNVQKTTRIVARGACSLNTAGDRTFDLSLYGLVP